MSMWSTFAGRWVSSFDGCPSDCRMGCDSLRPPRGIILGALAGAAMWGAAIVLAAMWLI